MKKFSILTIAIVLMMLSMSCRSIPKGATAVSPFHLEQYLGSWYEIARMDFKFEKGMDNVTANYTLLPNGTVKVLNKGFLVNKNEWKEATGKAKFKGSSTVGELKVSFFGPFYTGYNVIEVRDNYEYALVVGKNTRYMWILSRQPTIPEHIKKAFIKQAIDLGYDTSQLVWTKQDGSTEF